MKVYILHKVDVFDCHVILYVYANEKDAENMCRSFDSTDYFVTEEEVIE